MVHSLHSLPSLGLLQLKLVRSSKRLSEPGTLIKENLMALLNKQEKCYDVFSLVYDSTPGDFLILKGNLSGDGLFPQ